MLKMSLKRDKTALKGTKRPFLWSLLYISLFLQENSKIIDMREVKYISICNQKGGVGKSCFTMLISSYLCYEKGKNVAIIDCDYPQHSVVKFRAWEIDQVQHNTYYNHLAKELFTRLGRPVYPVIASNTDNALNVAEQLLSKSKTKYDVVFFDLPGTVNNIGVLDILDQLDYYFTPIEASLQVLESSLSFACTINETTINRGLKNRIHLFWNKVDKRERNPLYQQYENDVILPLGLPLLKSSFPLSSRFRKVMDSGSRQFLISTIFPATDFSVRDTNIDVKSFVEEICSIIQITGKDGAIK